MPKFLLDANLSWKTAEFIESLGYEAKTVAHFDFGDAEDEKIVKLAHKKKMILITLDLDFGELYYFSSKKPIGLIMLKLRNQTVESVNSNLENFFKKKIINKKENQKALIIIDEKKIRIRRK
ncbi:DUF5615 family PIN-like protein [Patescibacteria group bacterium]